MLLWLAQLRPSIHYLATILLSSSGNTFRCGDHRVWWQNVLRHAMRFRPTPVDLLCQWVERLIQSHNGNLCLIKFLYSNTDNIQGMMNHGHGLGVIRKHLQHRKYSWVIFSCLLLFRMVSTPWYVCILCSIRNAVLSILQPHEITTKCYMCKLSWIIIHCTLWYGL